MSTDRQLLTTILQILAMGVSLVSNPANAAHALSQRHRTVYFTDGGTAATAQTETPFAAVDPAANLTNWQIKQCSLIFPIAITANNSNYATFTVNKRTSGGAAVQVAQNTTQISDGVLGANVVAFQAYNMTLSGTAANLVLAAATDVLTFAMTKTGTGVAVAAATSQAYCDVLYEEQ